MLAIDCLPFNYPSKPFKDGTGLDRMFFTSIGVEAGPFLPTWPLRMPMPKMNKFKKFPLR